MIPVITIEGATASGKSYFAYELAKAMNTEIISADSRQIYRCMDIGTAKVSKDIQSEIPHHLIDIRNPNEKYNAGLFRLDAAKIITELWARGKIPIICGGTGLYVRSLLQGLCEIPSIPPDIRDELKQIMEHDGIEALYGMLSHLDPVSAARISNRDPQRILRALEVAKGTGKPLSEYWQNQKAERTYSAFRILIERPRKQLYELIDQRLKQMVADGLLEEIDQLLNMGYTLADPGLNCLGYKEFVACVQGGKDVQQVMPVAAQHQRNYAKRQETWYRKCTFDMKTYTNGIRIDEVIAKIQEALYAE